MASPQPAREKAAVTDVPADTTARRQPTDTVQQFQTLVVSFGVIPRESGIPDILLWGKKNFDFFNDFFFIWGTMLV